MGRYAFFHPTDFEYKFAFALQPSSDIRSFGGVMRHSVAGDMAHEWEKRDMEDIMMELEVLINSLEIDMPKFESYQKTLDGTHRISSDLYDLLGSSHHNQTLVARFRLGCFIYHQLLYVEKLGVNYET